tara:strand:+ start:273903 stop:274508 length:606 start_codon:yes stop_codon:yes gene_type:complete
MRDFKDWGIKDKFPNKDLKDIEIISQRLFSLVSRNKESLNSLNYAVEILGALDIIEALDYHFYNFIKLKDSEKKPNHEIVAYLNRLGQFYYFIKSDFVNKIVPNAITFTPKIEELKIFRMKNTAHRSIDYPKNEDSIEYRYRHALSFFGFIVNKYMGMDRYTIPIEKNKKTEWKYFIPENDHPIIMNETYQLIDKLIIELR